MSTTVPIVANKEHSSVPFFQKPKIIMGAYAVLIAANFPLLFPYFKSLWGHAHYQFFPFALLAVIVLAYKRWPREGEPFFNSTLSTLFLVAGGMAMILAAVFIEPSFAATSLACFVTSLFFRTHDRESGGSLAVIALPLYVIIRPPIGGEMLITWLQQLSSKLTSCVLDILGYKHHLAGTVLQFPNQTYGVEEACSGVQSFYTLLFCTTIFIIVARRTFVRSICLLIASVFWAVIMNTVRIMLIPIADQSLNINLVDGIPHAILGYTTLSLAVLAMVSTDQLLNFLLGPIDSRHVNESPGKRWSIMNTWNRLVAGNKSDPKNKKKNLISPFQGWGIIGSAVVCGLLFFHQVYAVMQSQPGNFFLYDVLVPLQEESLPGSLLADAKWKQTEYSVDIRTHQNELGTRSDTWMYQTPVGEVSTSFDQAFQGWHELTICYRNQGWTLASRQKVNFKIDDSNENWPLIEAKFKHPTKGYSYLLFSLFDINGEPFDAPEFWGGLNSFLIQVKGRLSHRVRARLFRSEAYQVQVFHVSPHPTNEETKKILKENYLKIREHLRAQFASGQAQVNTE